MKFLGMGWLEVLVILAIVLIIFGPKQLPKLGKALDKTVKSLKSGLGTDEKDKEAEAAEEVEVEVVPAPAAAPSPAPATTAAPVTEGAAKKTVVKKTVVKKKAE